MLWIFHLNNVANTWMFKLLFKKAYTESRTFLILPCQTVGWVYKLRGNRTSTDDTNWPKGFPYYMMSCWAIKVGLKKEEGGHLKLQCLSYILLCNSQITITHTEAQLSRKWLNICLPNEKEWMNSLFCFAFMCNFALLILSLSQHTFFSFLHFWSFPLTHHRRVSEYLSGALNIKVKPQQ